jgi:hypothetical protein
LSLAVLLWANRGSAKGAFIENYEAAAGCPPEAWFEMELGQRSPPSAGWNGAVRVQVEARGSLFIGRVERVDAGADTAIREVEHESCEQVVRALALIASLLLTPGAEGASPSAAGAPAGLRTASPLATSPALAPAEKSLPPARGAATPSRAWRFRHALSVGLTVQTSIAPETRFGPRVGYRLLIARERSQSELGLSFTRLQSGTIDVQVGRAELTYSAARLEFCQAAPLTEPLWLAPCAMLDVGEVRGRGAVMGQEQSLTRAALWLSPGLFGKLELRPGRPLFVDAAAGVFFPLSRPEFHFTLRDQTPPQRTIYRTPEKLGLFANFSFGVLFP